MTSATLRFVQLRRLVEPEDTPGDCVIGREAIGSAVDFSDAWSPEVKEAVSAGNRERGLALLKVRQDAFGQSEQRLARVALAALKRASINARLTLGDLRASLPEDITDRDSGQNGGDLKVTVVWAVDMITLLRWLRPESADAGMILRLLRGLVLLRLARSRAEDGCRVRQLIAGRDLRLPPLPPRGRDDGFQMIKELTRLDTLSVELDRVERRAIIALGKRTPVLGDVQPGRFNDLETAARHLQQAATDFGLAGTATFVDMRRVLEAEKSAVQRSASLDFNLEPQSVPIDLYDYYSTDSLDRPTIPSRTPVLSAYARILGRGDLMIIRTEHLRYDMGEISHIENVLATEVRGRTHVVDTETTETVTESLQTVSETTSELETTEQNSLDRALSTVATQTSSTSLGVSISGGFGPIRAGLDVGADRSTSTTASMDSAVSYSKSLTEKASELLRNESAYSRTTTTRTQVTETNEHRFDNAAGSANIAGIYRWVDKIDNAQLYNYGERLLLEFITPEPAAQIAYQAASAAQAAATPEPAGWFLDIEELNENNYVAKAARWDVLGLEPPPEYEMYASATVIDPPARPYDYEKNSTDKSQPVYGYSANAAEVAIPMGYAAAEATVAVTWGLNGSEYDDTDLDAAPQGVEISVGDKVVVLSESSNDVDTVDIDPALAGPLAIGVSADQRGGLTVAVRVRCVRTDATYEAWRLRTYEAIRAGYLTQLAAYENDQRLQQTQAAYRSENPPEINRQIEMAELKRACQTILSGQDFSMFGALDFQEGDAPMIDRLELQAEADYIQFFEDLFEWDNMVYLFYPYQWAGRERWAELQSRSSSDLLHQAFLQAGAARVVVPVRQGYEHAVGRFLTSSEIPTVTPQPWRGGSNPYPPIEELIGDALDRPGEETPVGEPWEVTTPTSLIYLQVGVDLNPAS